MKSAASQASVKGLFFFASTSAKLSSPAVLLISLTFPDFKLIPKASNVSVNESVS